MKFVPLLMLGLVGISCGADEQDAALVDSLPSIFAPIVGKKDQVTQIRIRGLTTMSEGDALALMGERLAQVTSQVTSPSRASDAAFIAEQLFHNQGYAKCAVTWQIVDVKTLELKVDEGARKSVGRVVIQGETDSELRGRLEQLFALPATKRSVGYGSRPPFLESDVQPGLDLVTAEYQSRGYWEAKASVVRQDQADDGQVNFEILVEPGAKFLMAKAQWDTPVSSHIQSLVSKSVGQPADTAKINEFRATLEDELRREGYTDAKIEISQRLENPAFIPVVHVVLGAKFTLRSLSYTGLKRTNSERISQRLQGFTGKTLDQKELDKRLRGFMATGAFSSVRYEAVKVSENQIDGVIHFEEARTNGYSLSAGLDSFEGPIIGASYYERNFLNGVYNLNSGLEISARTILGEVSVTDPWLWGSDYSSIFRGYLLTRNYEGYRVAKAGGEVGINYQPAEQKYQIQARSGLAIVQATDDGVPLAKMGETTYANPYARVTQIWNHQDSSVLPTKGWKVSWPIELGAAIASNPTAYLKTEGAFSYYYPLKGGKQLAFSARAGSLISSGENYSLPIDLRYFLGGARTVRSFPEREMGVTKDEPYPIGGETYWLMNAEYLMPISGPVKWANFVDVGNLSEKWYDLNVSEASIAVGTGLRIDLPIGPIRLEYGYNLTRRMYEPVGTFHFAIGVTF